MRAASVTTVLGLILISGALLAATTTPTGHGDGSSRAAFERLDRNGDQRIDRQEAEANAGLATHFAKFDRDSDDTLSFKEFLRHDDPGAVQASEQAHNDEQG